MSLIERLVRFANKYKIEALNCLVRKMLAKQKLTEKKIFFFFVQEYHINMYLAPRSKDFAM